MNIYLLALIAIVCLGLIAMLVAVLVVVWLQNRQANREMKAPVEAERPPAPDWLEELASATEERAPGDLQASIQALLVNDRKIEAIKIYREATGVGLKEAKDAVEAIEKNA